MKQALVILVLVVLGGSLQGQTWDEWFKQRKTQRSYLLKQIAALQVYVRYLQDGYEIASNGLTAISGIKNGDFNLHDGFFNSLKLVKPAIRNSAIVANIIRIQQQIIRQGRSTIEFVKESDQFTVSEIIHVKKVFNRLLDNCIGTLAELMMVVTNGELEMKDDERIQRIEKIRNEMEEKYIVCRSFADDARILAGQRLAEQFEVQRSKKLFGLH